MKIISQVRTEKIADIIKWIKKMESFIDSEPSEKAEWIERIRIAEGELHYMYLTEKEKYYADYLYNL